jgi:hypothetical protein
MEVQGRNDFMEEFYDGPCPPYGTHHYFFKVFALDKGLDILPHASACDLEKAMMGHVVGYGELGGIYHRN